MAIDSKVRKRLKLLIERFLKPNIYKTLNKFLPVGKTAKILFKESVESIYCVKNTSGYNDYTIMFGINFLYKVFNYENRKETLKEFKQNLPNLKLVMIGTYFHEVGHLVFTDMEDRRIGSLPPLERDGKTYAVASIAHDLFNILEDIVMEHSMSVRYKSSIEKRGGVDDNSLGSILKRNRKFIVSPSLKDYKDEEHIGSLLNYLLLKLSLPKDFIGTNKFFDDHIENKEYVNKFLKERNGTKRIDILLEYWNWLMTTDIKFPETNFENPMDTGTEGSSLGSKPKKASSGTPSLGGASDKGEDEGEGEGESGGSSSGGATDSAPEAEDTSEEPAVETINEYIDDDIFAELSDDEIDWSQHRVVDLKNYNFPLNDHYIEEVSKRVSELTQSLLYYFSMLRERNKPKYLSGLITGSKLDMGRITRGEKLRVFKEKLSHQSSQITGITLLCDNSGSMRREKSELLQLGVVAMSDMMTKLNIPFSVYAFSDYDSNTYANTFVLKEFDDDYNNPLIRNHFNMLSSKHYEFMQEQLEGYYMFNGNRDEFHVDYLCRKLRSAKLDNKILIVFSDGMPYESYKLKNIVKRNLDINIIGVGLCSGAVKEFYRNYRVFNDEEELENLPEFLGSLLLDLIN